MAALYRSADVMLNPSLADNMPISVLEALASGVPVVTTNVGGVPYLVEHEKDGLAGATPKPGSHGRGSRLLLLNDPVRANEIRQAGIDSVRQYAWPNVRAPVVACLRTAAGRDQPFHGGCPMNPGSQKRDFYTTFISGVFFPLHELIKKHDTVAIRKEMEASQWWDPRAGWSICACRDCDGCSRRPGLRVPYYRSLFADIGFKVEDVASLADLARLPLLDKSTIRANSEALKAENATASLASTRAVPAANR